MKNGKSDHDKKIFDRMVLQYMLNNKENLLTLNLKNDIKQFAFYKKVKHQYDIPIDFDLETKKKIPEANKSPSRNYM